MDSQKIDKSMKEIDIKSETQKELEIWELANHQLKNHSAADPIDETMAAGSAYAYFKIKKFIKNFALKLKSK